MKKLNQPKISPKIKNQPSKQRHLPYNSEKPKLQPQINAPQTKSYSKIQPSNNQEIIQNEDPQPNDSQEISTPSNSRNINIIWLGLGLISLMFVLLLAVGFINRLNSSGGINVKETQTPSNLIAEAQASVIEFQRTKESSVLIKPLKALEDLKNKQGDKLDNEGEQSLSRLKHKYAIEVLASSGQKAEAKKLLKQIPSSYSDYQAVKEWLNEN